MVPGFPTPTPAPNLLDWCFTNTIAVALHCSVYLWNASSGDVNPPAPRLRRGPALRFAAPRTAQKKKRREQCNIFDSMSADRTLAQMFGLFIPDFVVNEQKHHQEWTIHRIFIKPCLCRWIII